MGFLFCCFSYFREGLAGPAGGAFDVRGPVMGDDVLLGTGAKILGPVRIGDRVRVGANAVVLEDVPTDHTAIGVPARARLPRNTGLRAVSS